jgi:STE24 endopeptidase
MTSPFFWLFVSLFTLHQVWEIMLTLLNRSEMEKHRGEIPEFFKDKIDPQRYQKSLDYNLEKSRFGLLVRLYDIALVWGIILSGVLNKLDLKLTSFDLSPIPHSIVYCGVVALALMVLKLPVSLYSHFVIEEKYGFNKMTAKTFVIDLIKTLGLGIVLGGAILGLVFWLYQQAGEFWWLWAFGAVYGFEFLMAAVYPTLLAPIFNKFIPLPEGTLKDAITNLARKIDFKMSGIFTIDGSKRSAHSNAYFAGMGRMRRIVLFDTLQKQLSEREIIAVLGHEMGHNKLKHIQKQLVLGFVVSLASFWILSQLMTWPPFFAAFSAGDPAPHKALVIFALFSGHFTFVLTAVTNALSRRYEYASDRFSVEVVKDPDAMISSLVALSRENLSNLTPHPWFSAYHYTHPTTLERVDAIQRQAS